MKHITLVLMLVTTLCQGQQVFNVAFDQPPALPPGGYSFKENYFEEGMWFRHDPTNIHFQLMRGIPGYTGVPDNGTTYLLPAYGVTLALSLTNNTVFDLMSVDLSKFASEPNPSIGSFVGYVSDGSTVSTNFSVSGLAFQTFNFGSEFSSLTRIETVSRWSLDNLVFSTIPEPSTFVLFGLVGLLFAANRVHQRSSRQ